MERDFLIIGLTGALGSGCSTVANFLSNDLNKFSLKCKSKLEKTETLIGEYYEYLKEQQNECLDKKTEFNRKKEDIFIKPQELYSLIDSYYENTSNTEEYKKIINRNLRKLLHNRDIYSVFTGTKWEKFINISMSSMIVKLILENVFIKDSEDKTTDEFNNFCEKGKVSTSILDDIRSLAKEHSETIKKYNNIIDNKEYSKLNVTDCKHIDELFESIGKLKNKLKQEKDEQLLQDIGDNLRATGNPFKELELKELNTKLKFLDIISKEANRYLKYMRKRPNSNDKNNYFVIDSFRNPMELIYFRERYGSFYVCSVYADINHRRKRMEDKSKTFSIKRDERDQGKNNSPQELYKQNVSLCALMADYAVNNEEDKEALYEKIIRLLSLINKPGCTQPTSEETFMNIAYVLSLRTTCISRHVGAVITNKEGYIIGAGWNDVGSGQLGCSTRCIKDFNSFCKEDSLLSVWQESYNNFDDKGLLDDYKKTDYFCFKDLQSKLIIKEKVSKIIEEFDLDNKIEDIYKRMDGKVAVEDNGTINEIMKLKDNLKEYIENKLSVKRLEYARALHAEENAILQVSRNGGIGIKGGTIYVTTFPCELCAKKIYQSGIKRIVYTEPYPNSISEKIILKDGIRDIEVHQFEGVKSNSYYRLFKPYFDRKEMQIIDGLY